MLLFPIAYKWKHGCVFLVVPQENTYVKEGTYGMSQC